MAMGLMLDLVDLITCLLNAANIYSMDLVSSAL